MLGYFFRTFVNLILINKKLCEFLKSYDIIVAVPVHKKRKAKRGYDQSVLIARELSRNLDGPKFEVALEKVKNTNAQSLLNAKARLNNVKNVYKAINKETIYGKRVILFDDVFTSRRNS